MQNINRVVITGNLTKDPELHDRGSTKVCNMRVAVNGRIKDQSGEWVDKPNYFDVVTFGAQAENSHRYLAKGKPIAVEGRLDWREWQTEDGGKRQAVQIIANMVQFLDTAERGEGRSEAPAQAAPVSAPPADDDIPF